MLRDSVIYTACAVLQGGGELRWDNWVESRCIVKYSKGRIDREMQP